MELLVSTAFLGILQGGGGVDENSVLQADVATESRKKVQEGF